MERGNSVEGLRVVLPRNIPGKGGSTWRCHLCSRSLLCFCCCHESGFPALDLGCKQGHEVFRKTASVCAPRQLSQRFLDDTGRGPPATPPTTQTLMSHFCNPCAVKRRRLGRNLNVLILKHERRVQWGRAAVPFTRLTV